MLPHFTLIFPFIFFVCSRANGDVVYPQRKRFCDQCKQVFSFTSSKKLLHHQKYSCQAIDFKCNVCGVRKNTLTMLNKHKCQGKQGQGFVNIDETAIKPQSVMAETSIGDSAPVFQLRKPVDETLLADTKSSLQGGNSQLEAVDPLHGEPPLGGYYIPSLGDQMQLVNGILPLTTTNSSVDVSGTPPTSPEQVQSSVEQHSARSIQDSLPRGKSKHACLNCPKVFKTTNSLTTHMAKCCRRRKTIRKYCCRACSLQFVHKSNYLFHLSTHYEKSHCSICTKRFSYNTLLISHLNAHS